MITEKLKIENWLKTISVYQRTMRAAENPNQKSPQKLNCLYVYETVKIGNSLPWAVLSMNAK